MKKTVKTAMSIGNMLSLIEKGLVAFFMMMLEWSRIKRKKAEDEVANEQSKSKIKDGQHKIDMDAKDKTSDEIIDGYLDGSDDSPSGDGSDSSEPNNG